MRRTDRELVDEAKIESIIKNARYMHLGLFDDGYPYVVPLHYGYVKEGKNLVFYLHCAKEGHKINCIKNNNRVFVQIDTNESLVFADSPCKYSSKYSCVMCRGAATFVDDVNEKITALSLLMKTQTDKSFSFEQKDVVGVCIIKISVDSYTAKERI